MCDEILKVINYNKVIKSVSNLNNTMKFLFIKQQVRFFHRTVYDFLLKNSVKQTILKCFSVTSKNLFHVIIKINLFILTRRVYKSD